MKRLFARLGLGAVVAVAATTGAVRARAGFVAPPREQTDEGTIQQPADGNAADLPARRYGALAADECEAELARRGAPFVRVEEARGVLAPLRLTGSLHGVAFHSGVPVAKRASSPWEIVDCRLALALDDFALQLGAHDVVEVLHYSIYRPPSSEWPADRVATQHGGAMAMDAAAFIKKDGTKLDVEHDFHGHVGAHTCGPGTGPDPATPEALELRQIVCDAADAKLFNVALTPDFNQAHFNHFHLEVAAGSKWFMVQ